VSMSCHARRQWPTAGRAAGEVITVDGTTLRGAPAKGIGKEAMHLVSVWAQPRRLVRGQRAVDTTSNEITAISAVLHLLALHGSTVPIDAMGGQKAIARPIVRQGGTVPWR
ncbi:MAG: ISAs1 family transposase, partial [Chloroflexales bacterium]|nr:ISAs1 family transposase [Chloroflexales bacterium]